MSIEAYWYQCHSADGNPPKMKRLCRQPLERQWTAAIDLAIAYSSGEAGYRSIGQNTITGETTWLWPQPEGQWWLIPPRVEKRCFALCQAATSTEVRRGRGSASAESICRRLRVWKKTGHWRAVAATIHPRHGKPASKRTGRRVLQAG